MHYQYMTDAHRAFIAREWLNGCSKTQLADRYGISEWWVTTQIGRLIAKHGPSPRYAGEARRKQLVAAIINEWSSRRLRFDNPLLLHRQVTQRVEPFRHRPIDMGGPRDVWMEFGVSPDPRLDNQYPVMP